MLGTSPFVHSINLNDLSDYILFIKNNTINRIVRMYKKYTKMAIPRVIQIKYIYNRK